MIRAEAWRPPGSRRTTHMPTPGSRPACPPNEGNHTVKSWKRVLAATAGIALVGGVTAAGPAQADPSGPPTFRQLAGVGSDTTQGVMNGLSNVITDSSGNKLIGSYDATGSATIATHAGTACAQVPRPNGSGAGRTALLNSLNANDGCLQFSRSSSLNLAAATPGLTYIPFATDAVSYAVTANSNIPKTLALSDLQAIYHCDPNFVGAAPPFSITVILPQAGSGTRSFWESTMNILDTDVVSGKYPCIIDHKNGNPIEEHDGRVLDDNSIAPFSVSQYIAQSENTIPDLRGKAVLGVIDGFTPSVINNNFEVSRSVYNVIPTSQVNNAPYSAVFVGPGSAVCTNAAIINQYGFATNPNCGSTASHTP
jgi:ABC-type phosphate transport system substrate-binding protein